MYQQRACTEFILKICKRAPGHYNDPSTVDMLTNVSLNGCHQLNIVLRDERQRPTSTTSTRSTTNPATQRTQAATNQM
jgi:hypothetical protein